MCLFLVFFKEIPVPLDATDTWPRFYHNHQINLRFSMCIDVRYCDLYFIPRNSSIARKITIKKYKIDESELGETCIPTIISINNVDYQYSNYNWGDYLILKNPDGKTTRFNSIN